MKLLLVASPLLALGLALPNFPASYGDSLAQTDGREQDYGQSGNSNNQYGYEENGSNNDYDQGSHHWNTGCPVSITQREAEDFMNRADAVEHQQHSDLGDALQTAAQILAPDLQFVSYSVESLRGDQPVGLIISRASYIEGIRNGDHPPARRITTLLSTARCDQIYQEWQHDGQGDGRHPVRGFTWFLLRRVRLSATQRSPLQAYRHTVEFDTIASLLDTGGAITYANGTTFGDVQGKGCDNQQ